MSFPFFRSIFCLHSRSPPHSHFRSYPRFYSYLLFRFLSNSLYSDFHFRFHTRSRFYSLSLILMVTLVHSRFYFHFHSCSIFMTNLVLNSLSRYHFRSSLKVSLFWFSFKFSFVSCSLSISLSFSFLFSRFQSHFQSYSHFFSFTPTLLLILCVVLVLNSPSHCR